MPCTMISPAWAAFGAVSYPGNGVPMIGRIDPFTIAAVSEVLMSAILRPKIGIRDEFTIRQAVQKRQQIRPFRRGKLERPNSGILPQIFVAAAHVVIQDRIETR